MLTRPLPLLTRRLPLTRMMSTATTGKEVYFSTFEVSSQVQSLSLQPKSPTIPYQKKPN